MNQSAEPAEIPFTGGVQDRPGAEEQQALHERVIEGVIQHRDQRERSEFGHAYPVKDDGQADASEQHADVFDGRIGEQTFHVRLHCGEDHAKDCRGQSQRERDQAPPPQRVPDQVERHAQHAVDGCLQHDAAHQGRHG